MSNKILSEALCGKIERIVQNYVKAFPDEWANFRKQQTAMRDNLRTKWAEVNGIEGVVVRELLRTPETLWTLLKFGLTDAEYIEFTEEKYKMWFGNKFPDCKAVEGKL